MLKVALTAILRRYRIELAPNSRVDYMARSALRPRGQVLAVLHCQDGAFSPSPLNGNILDLVDTLD